MATDVQEILAAEDTSRRAFEAKTIAVVIGGVQYTVADLRVIFDRICDKADWKAPWAAYVHHALVPIVSQAVEWFHGDVPLCEGIEAITGRVRMTGRGYQAW